MAVITGGIFFLVLLAATRLTFELNPRYVFTADIGLVKNVGKTLFHEFLLPFEISSVLFLSAMVGAVMFGKKDNA
jgi:NADH-quinone oxidoreductase subunit J